MRLRRVIYDDEDMRLNYAKRRVTDVKGNSRVILPKRMRNFETEAKLEMFRVESKGVFKQFLAEKCRKNGAQKSNLTKSQLKGLKSLKTRLKDGELVVVPTDKTGNFAVLTRETYLVSGMKHTRGDIEVGWKEVEEAQKEVNGHVAMILKIFRVGEYWGHVDRVRETMLGNDMTVCPISLLYKDHKDWVNGGDGVPPTRHVAGGHVGLNLYISELVSDILEPMVSTLKDGEEVISTEDLLARVDRLNEGLKGWHVGSHWDGVMEGDMVACGRCMGKGEYNFMVEDGDRDNPEWCTCTGYDGDRMDTCTSENELVKGSLGEKPRKLGDEGNTTMGEELGSDIKGEQPVKSGSQNTTSMEFGEVKGEQPMNSMEVENTTMKLMSMKLDDRIKGTQSRMDMNTTMELMKRMEDIVLEDDFKGTQ